MTETTNELPFHVDAGQRFVVRMWKMSSYHRFVMWMLPSGKPFTLRLREWDASLVEVGQVTDPSFHGNQTKARAAALAALQASGYKPGMTADETRALLAATAGPGLGARMFSA